MNLSELQSLIGSLCSDPNHDRYSLADINIELDNTQDTWNLEAKLITDTVTLTVADGARQYALSSLTGTPISFPRVTHKGIDLKKRSKAYFDHLTGSDWTLHPGTPKDYFIEQTDPAVQYLTLYPVPQSSDIGDNLVVEYGKRHTAMSAASDVPFMSGTTSNYLLRPFDWGIAYSVSAKLLLRDPIPENVAKSKGYSDIAKNVLIEVVQVFKALEAEEPKRLTGGRYWDFSAYRQWK